MTDFFRFPHTPHLAWLGAGQPRDDKVLPPDQVSAILSGEIVVEEKLDGANAGISLGADGEVRLQSRGHILTGGPRERHFDLFKRWAACHTATLARVCADGATLYGEWLYAKHTVFYDQLPHYFLEFDLRDRDGQFWSPARRTAHLAACGAAAVVRQVPVVWAGVVDDPAALPALVAPSLYK